MGRRKERESKGQRGKKFFPPPSLLPPSRLSLLSCEGQAWRGCGLAQRLCTAPCGASHRNPINHWSRSLTPGHKDPTRRLHCIHLHMKTCKHNECLHICRVHVRKKKERKPKGKRERERKRILGVFTEVHVIISKMFGRAQQRKLRKECQIVWSHTKRAVLNWFSIQSWSEFVPTTLHSPDI